MQCNCRTTSILVCSVKYSSKLFYLSVLLNLSINFKDDDDDHVEIQEVLFCYSSHYYTLLHNIYTQIMRINEHIAPH